MVDNIISHLKFWRSPANYSDQLDSTSGYFDKPGHLKDFIYTWRRCTLITTGVSPASPRSRGYTPRVWVTARQRTLASLPTSQDSPRCGSSFLRGGCEEGQSCVLASLRPIVKQSERIGKSTGVATLLVFWLPSNNPSSLVTGHYFLRGGSVNKHICIMLPCLSTFVKSVWKYLYGNCVYLIRVRRSIKNTLVEKYFPQKVYSHSLTSQADLRWDPGCRRLLSEIQ